jgi:predicted RNA binding protein YcfA (HicA-like mRNA interferase family)
MRLPRDMAGRDLARALEKAFGYRNIHQVGSHMVLQAETPGHHRIAIPDHRCLRLGTLNSIVRAVARAQRVSRTETLDRLFP